MTKSEIAELLAMIAAYDQRTVGDADIEAWHAIAQQQGWTWAYARRAVIDYHSEQAERGRIRPAHITDIIARRKTVVRHVIFGNRPLVPPSDLGGDIAAELAWRKRHVRDAVDRAMTAWASGEPIPPELAP